MPGSIQMPGLSGFDSGTLIDQLMEVEKKPLYDKVDKKNQLGLKKELYSEINLKVYDFQAEMFDLTLESTFRNKSSVVSDESVMSAKAGVDTINGTFTFKNITLATPTIVASNKQMNSSSILSSSESVGSIDITKSFSEAGFTDLPQGSVTVNGVEFELSHFSSVESFMTAVENNVNADIADFSFNTTTNTFSITADSGKDIAIFETKGYGESGFLSSANIDFIDRQAKIADLNTDTSITSGIFTINGVDFNINRDIDSLDNIIKRINASDAGVIAFYDEVTEKLTLTAKDEGNTEIVLEDKSSNFLEVAGLKDAVQDLGTNATFEYNGVATERSSNEFEINGVTFDLKQASAGPVTVTIETNVGDLSEKMEKFVEDYNEIMEFIYEKLNEEEATEEEINTAEDYETLTSYQKQGLLRRDSTLRDLQDRMKNFFASTYAGYTMEDVGIEGAGATGTVSTEMKKGLIEFDKEKFEKAMQDMPEIVEAMFRNDGETIQKKNYVIAVADGAKSKFSLGYRNIGQDLKVMVGSQEYKVVTNPSAADEISLDRDSGYIEFFQPPANGSEIVATYEAYEGEKFEELEKNIGTGNGYRTSFTIGSRNIGQNVSLVVGDGSKAYTQVESKDELTGDTYFVDRKRGKIIFAEPVAEGQDVKVGYNYTVAQKGIFNTIYEDLKAYTGVGILYQAETSLNSEISTIEDSITNLNSRLESKEERLWKIYTNLEVSLNEMNSQSSWLASQIANLA